MHRHFFAIAVGVLIATTARAECPPIDAQTDAGATSGCTKDTATDARAAPRAAPSKPAGKAAANDEDEDAWIFNSATGTNMNYGNGDMCVTKGANGVCLDSDDE